MVEKICFVFVSMGTLLEPFLDPTCPAWPIFLLVVSNSGVRKPSARRLSKAPTRLSRFHRECILLNAFSPFVKRQETLMKTATFENGFKSGLSKNLSFWKPSVSSIGK